MKKKIIHQIRNNKYELRSLQILSFLLLISINTSGLDLNYQNQLIQKKEFSGKYTYVIIISNANTWGYDIFDSKRLLIHQGSIPGIHGNMGFKTKNDAEKVAKLVIEKLKKGEFPPSVCIDELKKLNVK